MPRARKTAAVQKPGAAGAPKPGAEKSGNSPPPAAPQPSSAAEAAKAARVDGPVDPTRISKPVMTERGWLCPAPPQAKPGA